MRELFERYVRAGLAKDAGAVAAMFTEDGVFDAPLMPPGGPLPARMTGRDEIEAGLAAYYARPAHTELTVLLDRSRLVLHTTDDPAVFIAEIDTAYEKAGEVTRMSLVQIFRLRDGKIALLRDYFAPEHLD
ncbi:nuclear transport factor 2 family protein [Actinosynnema sp. NPDC023658]|uniref:nuclear transport factor 2 family protein n=1 Tax=Actinosynnema sp. NPDC023658 TaxID=3155465 RepID=UPI0033C4C2D6